MTWQTEMTLILRGLINDVNPADYTYSDSRLQQSILISGQLVQTELVFDKTYEVNVIASSIVPDPTDVTKDNAFINLVCLKSAALIYGGELKLYSGMSMRVVDGPSTIDTTTMYGNYAKLYQTALENYGRAKNNYIAGNSIGGQIITTPITYQDNTTNPTVWDNLRW